MTKKEAENIKSYADILIMLHASEHICIYTYDCILEQIYAIRKGWDKWVCYYQESLSA